MRSRSVKSTLSHQNFLSLPWRMSSKNLTGKENGINNDGVRPNHLRFADDIVVVASTGEELKDMFRELRCRLDLK